MAASVMAWMTALAVGVGTPAPVLAAPQAPQPTVAEQLRLHLEQLRETGALTVAGLAVDDPGLFAFYEPHDFEPVWTAGAAAELAAFVRGVDLDGLEPGWYGSAVLDSLVRVPASSTGDRAAREVLLTQVLLRLAHDLRRGVVDPGSLGPEWADTPRGEAPPAEELRRMVEGGNPGRGLAALRPTAFVYQGLVGALARYRAIEASGGWPQVGEGPLMGPDSVSARVPRLRVRLLRTGDLEPGSDSVSPLYDEAVEAAVRRFQHRQGLNDDGLVGQATRAALDVPVETRVLQLRLNLERARWVAPGLADDYVAVNIAGQRVYLIRDGQVAWETRAVVGQPYTRTPVFRADMRYLVLNPTWTVPRSINREILARLRREPGYLEAEGFDVLDASGAVVDPAGIDFERYTGQSFPWVFRQRPGPTNALGRVKFMFPNAHKVYLHDTPARYLFAREERTFSHGCIRVEDPLRLAELLLAPQGGPDRAGLEALLAGGETRTIQLHTPLPVLVLYWTASTDLHGEVHFYGDVYDRDAPLAEAFFAGPR